VSPVNDLPVAVADTFTFNEDTTLNGNLATNDTPSGDGGNVWSVLAGPTHGTLTINPDGTFTYVPAANYNGADSFTYQITDADGSTSTATVTLNVSPVNDVPVAVNDAFTFNEDTTLNGNLATNDTPSGDGGNVWSVVAGPAHGTLTINANGTFTYVPVANYNGPDSFTYKITDVDGSTSTATVTLTVTAVNDAPIAAGGAVTGTEDTPLVFTWAQFGVTDVDSPLSSQGVTISTLPASGALQFFNGTSWVAVALNQTITEVQIAAGNLRFVPAANASGDGSFGSPGTGNLHNDYANFTFKPTDGSLTGGTATMTVDITPVADTPTLTTNNHQVLLFTTSFETTDTGLSQGTLNPNTTSTSTITQTTLSGWTRIDSPDPFAGGNNAWELWSTGDTMQNQAGVQTPVTAKAGDGTNWLELNNADGNGALTQTLGLARAVATTAGYVYDLSFDYAGRPGFTQDYTKITVLVNGVAVASYGGTSGQNGLNWENLHFSFVGTGGNDTIQIITDATTYNSNGRGAMIDNIQLTEAQGAQAGNSADGTHTVIALTNYVHPALTDTDGSETMTLTFSGLPVGATILTSSHPTGYTVTGGAITIPASELASAVLQLPETYVGGVALTVTATSHEPNGSTASTTQPLNFDIVVGAHDVSTQGSTHTLMSSTASLASATGLHGEYYGYNETAAPGAGYNLQAGDGTVGNLDSIADITSIINLRQGSTLVGTNLSGSAAASDAAYTAHNITYGQSIAVNGNLGSNPNTAVGAAVTSGALWNFLGGTQAGNDTGTLVASSSFGKTTDSIMRMVGSVYFTAGSYDFQALADDGFSIRIDGQIVLAHDGNQSATTSQTASPVALSEGLHTIEILYWEQGGFADLALSYKPTGTSTFLSLSTDHLAMFQPGSTPTLTDLQDIIPDPTNAGHYLVRTGQEDWGGSGAETITGSAGRDIIHAGGGNDIVIGGGGADRLEGGAGNDTLTGAGAGSTDTYSDTFKWSLGDASPTLGTPAKDVITDFTTNAANTGGDVLDLRDLLVGELHGASNAPGNLTQYLDFDTTSTPGSTIIHISSQGQFTAGYAAGVEDQTITLQGVDLRSAFGLGSAATDAQLIQELLARGKLVTDGPG
jgi:VCBS repeat-containing protein